MRQPVEWNPRDPLRVAAPSLGRRRSVAVRPDGNPRRRVVADVAVDVGIYDVLSRHDNAAKRREEVVPVARLVYSKERGHRGVVRIEAGPAQRQRLEPSGPGRALQLGIVGVEGVGDERPVARDAHLEADRRVSFHHDRFAHDLQRLRSAAEFGKPAGGIELLAIEILDIRGDVGHAPRDMAVAAERDRRRAGQRRADRVEVARRHVRQIPHGGQPGGEMRIVGQERLAGRRQRAVDDPVVRADRFSARAAEQEIGDRGRSLRQSGREGV